MFIMAVKGVEFTRSPPTAKMVPSLTWGGGQSSVGVRSGWRGMKSGVSRSSNCGSAVRAPFGYRRSGYSSPFSSSSLLSRPRRPGSSAFSRSAKVCFRVRP